MLYYDLSMLSAPILKKKPILVFVGTYPPRECGIGTFTQDLVHSIQKLSGKSLICQVAAFNISAPETYEYPDEVKWEIAQDDIEEHLKLASEINNNDLIDNVIIQHEYGIYGGDHGENIIQFLKHCKKTKLICFHTVLPDPSDKMKLTTKEVLKYSDLVVVLTKNSKRILEEVYPEIAGKVFVIPHGIHPIVFSLPKKQKEKLGLEKYSVLTTFGLLSRGKGIEYVLKALPKVIEKHPEVRYLVLGETHPVLRRSEGEKYRLELIALVKKLGLTKFVKFYDKYFTLEALLRYLQATDIYIATPLDPNQAASGTFSYAIGSGRAVVTTGFAQAKEVITPGMGRLVPTRDSEAYTNALLEILGDKKRHLKMHRTAYCRTRSMVWPNVGHEYLRILDIPLFQEIDLTHFKKMTDSFGMFQFAALSKPDPKYGYTLDDNARALVVSNWLIYKNKNKVYPYLKRYLHFLKTCQRPDGSFVNYITSKDNLNSLQNTQEDLEDSFGRAMWALAETISNKNLSPQVKRIAHSIWNDGLVHADKVSHLRARAYIIKAISVMLTRRRISHIEAPLKILTKHSDALLKAYKHNSEEGWTWFEEYLSYANAMLPESLLIAGGVTGKNKYLNVASKALDFLIKHTFMGDIYIPIGQDGWFKKGSRRSSFDQQPEDPAAMVMALAMAYQVFGEEKYKKLAIKCFSWFYGNNLLGLTVYEPENGGVYDGITKYGINRNQGAESLVSYLMSRIIIEEIIDINNENSRN
jgi:glycosyltransferase involved in cell wall biosynthesis